MPTVARLPVLLTTWNSVVIDLEHSTEGINNELQMSTMRRDAVRDYPCPRYQSHVGFRQFAVRCDHKPVTPIRDGKLAATGKDS